MSERYVSQNSKGGIENRKDGMECGGLLGEQFGLEAG